MSEALSSSGEVFFFLSGSISVRDSKEGLLAIREALVEGFWGALMVKDDSSDSIKWDKCIKESLWKFYFIINEKFVLSRNMEVAFKKTLRGAKNRVNSMAEGVDRFHMFKAPICNQFSSLFFCVLLLFPFKAV